MRLFSHHPQPSHTPAPSPAPERYAVFVDANYLAVVGQVTATGIFRRRNDFTMDQLAALRVVRAVVEQHNSGREPAGVWWYDAAPDRIPTAEHELLEHAGATVRVGTMTRSGTHKGVAPLAVLDMYDLSRTGAISHAVLLSGDADLLEGVKRCQTYDVHVTVLSFFSPKPSTSQDLKLTADLHLRFPIETIRDAFRPVDPASGDRQRPTGADDSVLGPVSAVSACFGRQVAASADPTEIRSILDAAPRVPPQFDTKLIHLAVQAVNTRGSGTLVLPEEAVHAMRAAFIDSVAKAATAPLTEGA